jgi:hypothetical protein
MEDAGKHDAGEVVEAFECGVESLVVAGKAAEASGPGEAAFDDPTGRRSKPRLAMGCLTTSSRMPCWAVSVSPV